MGELNKHVLVSYIESNCMRQMFLKLGKDDPEWISPLEELKPIKRLPLKSDFLKEMGHQYEQKVYKVLLKSGKIKYTIDTNGDIKATYLSRKSLLKLHEELKLKQLGAIFLLLEHEIVTPSSYLEYLFPIKVEGKKKKKKLERESGRGQDKVTGKLGSLAISNQRPDMIFLVDLSLEENVNELLPDGSVRQLTREELESRIGIRVVDIKNTTEKRVGNRQLIEIFHYLHVLSCFIRDNGLADHFCVLLNGNGILPRLSGTDLERLKNFKILQKEIVPLDWKAIRRVYFSIIDSVREIWSRKPCSLDDLSNMPINIQPRCGFCEFVEDCKYRLGMQDSSSPDSWSVELIPYTSTSMAKQLKEMGINTVGDVLNKLELLEEPEYPSPLHAEKPLILLKARSLLKGKTILPPENTIHSYLLPKYTSISITFTCESDPSNEVVFAASVLLTMFISKNVKYRDIASRWIEIWGEHVLRNSDINYTRDKLNKELNISLSHDKAFVYARALKELDTKFYHPNLNGAKNTGMRCFKVLINGGIGDDDEFLLAKQLIRTFKNIIIVTLFNENYIHIKEGNRDYRPNSGIFFWSRKQKDNIESLLERNLDRLMKDPGAKGDFLWVINYLTPSESRVQSHEQHLKLYDLKSFAESCLGYPLVINYSWHEIAKKIIPDFKVSALYWVPHYDFLDFRAWHQYLRELEKNRGKSQDYLNKIIKQVKHKTNTLDDIRIRMQIHGRSIISSRSYPKRSIDFRKDALNIRDLNFHPIAEIWYLFSRLEGAMDILECDSIRTTFPEYSIGKLNAARVLDLRIISLDEKYIYYKFKIVGLSSHVKLKENDRVFLIPDEMRDIRTEIRYISWTVDIKNLQWDSSINGYAIETKPVRKRNDIRSLCESKNIDPKQTTFYLYPWAMDNWTRKLVNPKRFELVSSKNHGSITRYNYDRGLLENHGLGESWLGKRLSFLLLDNIHGKFLWPDKMEFTAQEIYAYYPSILNNINNSISGLNVIFQKNITPPLDSSQRRAIVSSLSHVISAIQGPPGTGKTSTIVALLNTFYRSRIISGKKKIRILISAFSYTALEVVINKILNSRYEDGEEIDLLNSQFILMRSSYRKKFRSQGIHVDDLVREGKQKWLMNGKQIKELKYESQARLINDESSDNHAFTGLTDKVVFFANPYQLFHLREILHDFHFDLIVIDEGSQMPVDNLLSCLHFIKDTRIVIEPSDPSVLVMPGREIIDVKDVINLRIKNKIDASRLTKLVCVGDHNQLPPVRRIKPPKKLEPVLSSVFSYFVKYLDVPCKQLMMNYRSNMQVVEFTRNLGLYGDLNASKFTSNITLGGDLSRVKESWIKEVLEPRKILVTIIHDRHHETAISPLEAKIVSDLVINYYLMISPSTREEETLFWKEKIGVVAPHNAQGRLIIRMIYKDLIDRNEELTINLSNKELMEAIRQTVYSVEKFQGSDRDMIISTIGISDRDQLQSEEDFIYDLNRFNVLTSRAKCKFILTCSNEFLNYVPSDKDMTANVSIVHDLAMETCSNGRIIHVKNENGVEERVELRWKE
ncbi:MAG: AAA domain-containing protein [Promethearchaeota archaeon]